MSTLSEATWRVNNLRERGKQLYLKAKADRDRNGLELAVRLFNRGAHFPSPNVSPDARAKVNKNLLASFSLEQTWDDEENGSAIEPGDAFFTRVAAASAAYRKAMQFASSCSNAVFSSDWRQSLVLSFHKFVSEAVKIVAFSDGTSPIEDILKRAHSRVHGLLRFTNVEYSLAPSLLAHVQYRVVDVLLKASVVAGENDAVEASSFVLRAESHISCLEEAVLNTEKQCEERLPADMDVDALKTQVEYQICVAMSAQRIRFGYKILHEANDSLFGIENEHEKVLLAMDSLKEAQVLARETSLPQEAEACARLAFIYRAVQSVRDIVKSECYCMQAFNILESLGLQPYMFVDWAKEVIAQRERIQKERAKSADERKTPILEKHKSLIASIKARTTSHGNEKETLLFIYEAYPPKGGQEAPKKKIEDGDLKSAMKVTLLHYHPDRNRENQYGFDNAVICEEITKFVNLMYSRNFKSL